MPTKIKDKELDRQAYLTKVADACLAQLMKKQLTYREFLIVTNKVRKMAAEKAIVK